MSKPPPRPRIPLAAPIGAGAIALVAAIVEIAAPRGDQGAGAIEGAPGFYALIGALAVVVAWGLASLIRLTLGRREDHYWEDFDDGDQS